MNSRFFDALPAALQNAALEPSLWPKLLHEISRNIGGAGAVFFNTSEPATVAPCSPELEEMHQRYFEDGWYKLDTRYRGVPLMLQNGVTSEPEFISESEIRRDVFYQDFLERHRRKWFAGLGFRAGDDFWCLSIQRATANGPFEPGQLQLLGRLMQPFQDAAAVARAVGRAWLEGSTDALDCIGHAAFVCDQQGRVLDCNAPARSLAPLRIGRDRHIDLGTSVANDALHRMLATALRPLTIVTAAPPACRIALSTCTLVFRAVRLNGHARMLFTSASLLLLVKTEKPDAGVLLTTRYGLTPSEMRSAMALWAGKSIAAIAQSFQIRPDTVRKQLKSVYIKTGTNSQSQLVALIGRLMPRNDDERADRL